MRKSLFITFFACSIILCAGVCYAGVLDTVKNWMSGNVIAYILTGILSLSIIAGSLLFSKIIKTLQEAGEFMTVLGTALADRKVNADEIKSILKEAKDVFSIWSKTPDKYKVN